MSPLDNLITVHEIVPSTFGPRSSNTQQCMHGTPERIYALDHVDNNPVVAMASRLHLRYSKDGRTSSGESSLKYMTISSTCMPNGEGWNLSFSIAVEYFDPSPASQEYAFKCHRQTINDVDHVWPLDSLAFHPTFNTSASAGSDVTASIWDHKFKKPLRQYPKFPGGVVAVAFNCDGSRIGRS